MEEIWPPVTLASNQGAQVKRLFLCRHGETAANARGVLQGSGINLDLNDKASGFGGNPQGKAQAEALAAQLKDVDIDIIFCSKLSRARETAEFVAKFHPNSKFIEVEQLAEISWGAWEGSQTPNLPDLLNSWVEGNYHAKSPQGESPIDVEARAVPALYECILQHPGKTFVFVVHGRLLRILLSSVLFRSLDHMNEFTHHNTCINLVDVIIESDPAYFPTTPLLDIHNLLGGHQQQELDDNVHIATRTPVSPKPHIEIPALQHPPNLKFVPIFLDDTRHLPPELNN
ncbi:hypothetical protein HDV03_002955 [Kappamyces sp. JEL0829]|nr:hypothetical protein HDV03_002955 [Kappamyces sp. JEL0829]